MSTSTPPPQAVASDSMQEPRRSGAGGSQVWAMSSFVPGAVLGQGDPGVPVRRTFHEVEPGGRSVVPVLGLPERRFLSQHRGHEDTAGRPPIRNMLDKDNRRQIPALRPALQCPDPAEVIFPEVPDQLDTWGLPGGGVVPVLYLPQVLLELVLRHSWHSLMWRSTRAGGMLLQPVLDFPLLIGRAMWRSARARLASIVPGPTHCGHRLYALVAP